MPGEEAVFGPGGIWAQRAGDLFESTSSSWDDQVVLLRKHRHTRKAEWIGVMRGPEINERRGGSRRCGERHSFVQGYSLNARSRGRLVSKKGNRQEAPGADPDCLEATRVCCRFIRARGAWSRHRRRVGSHQCDGVCRYQTIP